MKLDTIEVAPFNQLQIREIRDDGGYHRKVLSPDMDVSSEDPKVQELAEELWTDEAKDAFAEHREHLQEKQKQENGEL